jgi:hypothetical protein
MVVSSSSLENRRSVSPSQSLQARNFSVIHAQRRYLLAIDTQLTRF